MALHHQTRYGGEGLDRSRDARRVAHIPPESLDDQELCLTESLDGRSVGQEIVLPGGMIWRRTQLAGTGGSLSELTRRGD